VCVRVCVVCCVLCVCVCVVCVCVCVWRYAYIDLCLYLSVYVSCACMRVYIRMSIHKSMFPLSVEGNG
jgi:hypothetical protein